MSGGDQGDHFDDSGDDHSAEGDIHDGKDAFGKSALPSASKTGSDVRSARDDGRAANNGGESNRDNGGDHPGDHPDEHPEGSTATGGSYYGNAENQGDEGAQTHNVQEDWKSGEPQGEAGEQTADKGNEITDKDGPSNWDKFDLALKTWFERAAAADPEALPPMLDPVIDESDRPTEGELKDMEQIVKDFNPKEGPVNNNESTLPDKEKDYP
ncbi:hypothetical protein [Mesorhizobium sp. B2-4-6]|uniref:hypothetical protein n=1 Tax=Mesorhizobium sp. B2-4-6 TaxID=2589943 RepID=UPI001127E71E|nr:hypothetical protein [Mesorhizobium sp. B2-4-6]TPL51626.1 hypothetical protein FJ957_08600 [Mesorhizobium sp. B2-4-6]